MTLDKATFGLGDADLEFMVLGKGDLPSRFQGHQVVREGVLDNETMAETGFRDSTAARFQEAGRLTGFMREFGPPPSAGTEDGFDFLAATVAHLFDTPESVRGWMYDVFLKDFEDNVGEGLTGGYQLISSERLAPHGFFDEAVALRVLQGGEHGLLSSTVVDFRLGRILGVAFVGTVGDHQRLTLATELGLALEKSIVRVALG